LRGSENYKKEERRKEGKKRDKDKEKRRNRQKVAFQSCSSFKLAYTPR
jgi:hypothetical protein